MGHGPRISYGELTFPLLVVRLFVVLPSGNGSLGISNWSSCDLHSVRYGVYHHWTLKYYVDERPFPVDFNIRSITQNHQFISNVADISELLIATSDTRLLTKYLSSIPTFIPLIAKTTKSNSIPSPKHHILVPTKDPIHYHQNKPPNQIDPNYPFQTHLSHQSPSPIHPPATCRLPAEPTRPTTPKSQMPA